MPTKLRGIAAGSAALVPGAGRRRLLVAASQRRLAGGVAAAVSPRSAISPGLLVERWLFFAEARHAVMNYYGG